MLYSPSIPMLDLKVLLEECGGCITEHFEGNSLPGSPAAGSPPVIPNKRRGYCFAKTWATLAPPAKLEVCLVSHTYRREVE